MIENLFGAGGGGGTVDTVVAGTGISVDSTDPANPIITNTSLNTDEVAKVSSNDTTAGYLNGKLVAGSGIALTENNNGGNETLGIAVSNLDAGAITTGTIATARLGTGTANSSTYLAGDQTYKAAVTSVNGATGAVTVGDTTYTVTIADVENTTTETTVAQFTVPANTWANGQEIILDVHFLVLNSTGTSPTVDYRVGGTGITEQATLGLTVPGIQVGAGANRTRLRFTRLGAGVAYSYISANGTSVASSFFDGYAPMMQQASHVWDSSVDFTTNITIYLKMKFNTASANLYARAEHARAYKINAGNV